MVVQRDTFNEEGLLLAKKGIKVSKKSQLYKYLEHKGAFTVSSSSVTDLAFEEKNKFAEKYIQSGIFKLEKMNFVTQKINRLLCNPSAGNSKILLATMADSSPRLYSHAINTGIIAGIIGEKLRYSGSEMDALLSGALLHDIAYLLFPDNFLRDRDQTDGNTSRHPEWGASILKKFSVSDLVCQIVEQHHEKCDGTGYPCGLYEENIHMLSQIVGISCHIDETTTHNSEAGNSLRRVISEILEEPKQYSDRIIFILKQL